jgi:hypothetical protein
MPIATFDPKNQTAAGKILRPESCSQRSLPLLFGPKNAKDSLSAYFRKSFSNIMSFKRDAGICDFACGSCILCRFHELFASNTDSQH